MTTANATEVDVAGPEEVGAVPVDTALDPADVECWARGNALPPLFIEARPGCLDSRAKFLDWVAANRSAIDDLVVRHGAIVFRGFPLVTAEDFNAFAEVFPQYGPGYVAGASPRQKVIGNVLESSRLDGAMTIEVHSEMNYLHDFPARICFFCEAKADEAGETTIADLREATRRMPKSWLDRVRALKVKTVRNFSVPIDSMHESVSIPEQMPWDRAFHTTDPDEVERICEQKGIECHWNDDGSLTVISLVEGVNRHPLTGQDIYRTIIHKPALKFSKEHQAVKDSALAKQRYRSGYTLGDGTLGTEEERAAVSRAIEDVTTHWPWRNGDVLLLDNLQIWHGRRPYRGSNRQVHVALLD